MKIKKPKMDKPTMAFFAIAIVSVGALVYPLKNYMTFYIALWHFDYQLLNLAMNASQKSNIQIDVQLLIMNPTDYAGLKATSVTCRLEYIGPEHIVHDPYLPGHAYVPSNIWRLKIDSFNLRLPLTAYANDTVTLSFTVNPYVGKESDKTDALDFIGFLTYSHPEQIEWRLTCGLWLSSFLSNFHVQREFSITTSTI